jgi:hypothetical protein
MTEEQRMKEVNLAYGILADPILVAQYGNNCSSMPTPGVSRFDPNGKGLWKANKTPWTEWPEGISFPRWRPSPPGAWLSDCATAEVKLSKLDPDHEVPPPHPLPKPKRGAPEEERSSQDSPRNRKPPRDTPHHLPQAEDKRHVREHDIHEPGRPPCMMYELRLPVPHPRQQKAREGY